MTTLYDDFAAAAIEMLADPEISQVITLKRAAATDTYDDETGTVTEGTEESFVGSGVAFDYVESLINGTNILQGDQKIYMAPNLGATPQNGDILEMANGDRKIVVTSHPLAPAGQLVLHIVQARDL